MIALRQSSVLLPLHKTLLSKWGSSCEGKHKGRMRYWVPSVACAVKACPILGVGSKRRHHRIKSWEEIPVPSGAATDAVHQGLVLMLPGCCTFQPGKSLSSAPWSVCTFSPLQQWLKRFLAYPWCPESLSVPKVWQWETVREVRCACFH